MESDLSQVREELIQGLGQGAENRVLTDFEDRYVYATNRVFIPEQEERIIPKVVIKAKSVDEVGVARKILEKAGFTPLSRDKNLRPRPREEDNLALIDYTEPILPPLTPESPTKLASFDDLRLEGRRPGADVLEDKCEDHTICKGYCPIGQTVYGDVETWSPKGRLLISRAIKREEDGAVEASEKVQKILFSCAACGNCFRNCTEDINRLFEGFVEAKTKLIERGAIEPTIQDVLENTFVQGNPYGESRRKREKWLRDSDVEVPVLDKGDSVDAVLFVGCSASYVDRNQEMARSLATVLDHLGVEFGVLGKDENCCGNSQRMLGEEGLFEEMVSKNSNTLSKVDFEHLVPISPHCFDSFSNEYEKYGGTDANPIHYTEFLAERLGPGDFSDSDVGVVTYHDPCYLERHNGVREAPRRLLEALPGAEFVDIGTTANCCGGGGGRMWFEDMYVEKRPSAPVVDDALDKDADVLAVACPFCLTNFEDAVKTLGVEDELAVRDINELLASAL